MNPLESILKRLKSVTPTAPHYDLCSSASMHFVWLLAENKLLKKQALEMCLEINRAKQQIPDGWMTIGVGDGTGQLKALHAELTEARRQLKEASVGNIHNLLSDLVSTGTTHIRKTGKRSFAGGEYAMYFECFKLEEGKWFYYHTDSDNEYPYWCDLKDGRYRKPNEIIGSLIPINAAPVPAQPENLVHDICNAYESGVGHAGRQTAKVNPYPPGTPQHTAYEIGANGMKHNAQASAQGDKP